MVLIHSNSIKSENGSDLDQSGLEFEPSTLVEAQLDSTSRDDSIAESKVLLEDKT